MRMEYRARDDYGLAGVVAEIRRPADAKPSPGAPIDLALPLSGARAKGLGYEQKRAYGSLKGNGGMQDMI